jgi:inorganic triphosphatase YgiF
MNGELPHKSPSLLHKRHHMYHNLSLIEKSYHEREKFFVVCTQGRKILASLGYKVYNGANGGGNMGFEYERKYRTDEKTLRNIHSSLSEPFYVFQMETTYYDTHDGALSQRKITLRRRYENGISVCTLKTPAGGVGRGEFQTEADSIEDAIPVLCKLSGFEALETIVAKGLTAVCGAKFTRIARKINFGSSTLELALDQGRLFGGNAEEPLCEVEVELKSGSETACDRYAMALATQFGLVPEPQSKFRRALALYKGE